jgi:hypothetical protein
MNYQCYLTGIEHGLLAGIPNISEQPWKILEIAIAKVEPWERSELYDQWQAKYKPRRPNKLQKKDLVQWGLLTA